MIEYVDHLREHFQYPSIIKNASYMPQSVRGDSGVGGGGGGQGYSGYCLDTHVLLEHHNKIMCVFFVVYGIINIFEKRRYFFILI